MTTSNPPFSLFDAFKLGTVTLKNRLVMAPMTRARSPQQVATNAAAQYYAQRSTAGLIVTEGIPVSDQAVGYVALPRISSQTHIRAWQAVTDAVHNDGAGHIFSQLWHVGRMSHRSLQVGGAAPVSSSAKEARGENVFGIKDDGTVGFVPAAKPRALSTDEIPQVVAEFRTAATNAVRAGFDGIEIHGATGYIFEQFLNPNVNDRTDEYGGTIANRARLLIEVVAAVVDAIGAERTAIRLSPFSEIFDQPPYPEAEDTYLFLAEALSAHPLAYVHLHELGWNTGVQLMSEQFLSKFRSLFGGSIILGGGLTKDAAADYVGRGIIDLAAFGRPYIANPDLVARFQHGYPLAVPDPSTFYGGGSEGYTDYPFHLEE